MSELQIAEGPWTWLLRNWEQVSSQVFTRSLRTIAEQQLQLGSSEGLLITVAKRKGLLRILTCKQPGPCEISKRNLRISFWRKVLTVKCGVKTDHDREKKEGSDKKSEPRASKTHGGNLNYVSLSERRRNGVAIMVNKRVWNAVLGCNLKNDRTISVRLQGKPFNITVIQVYAPTSNAEEIEVEWFYEDLQDLLELTP